MDERKKLELISSVEIMNTPMKKRQFIVDGMIYPGIHILSGDPKIGKSWMMLDMCLAVAKGEDFLGRKTEQGQVVYMALEDTFVSLQSRMYELTDEPSENLFFTLLANSIGSGLEEDLRDCKKMFPDLKMVVIDTLQKIRNNIDTKYGADYQELSILKSIADQLGIATGRRGGGGKARLDRERRGDARARSEASREGSGRGLPGGSGREISRREGTAGEAVSVSVRKRAGF